MKDFHGLPLGAMTCGELVDWLVLDQSACPRAVGYLNAHTTRLALRPGGLVGPLLRRFDLLYADGMSVVRAARRRGMPLPERTSAADFFWRFCWAAAARGRRLALIGGPPGLTARCEAHLRSVVGDLQVVFLDHGFHDERGLREVRARLRKSRPDIVLLGMGTPAQEALALVLRDEDGLATSWCVGALFEYFTPGVRRHAPLWMRRHGLEWSFRLAQEPRRLAGRYLAGNVEFLLRERGFL